MHRSEYRVQAGIRERSSGMHDRRRSAAHGVGERLVAEYAREPAGASPALVRLDVTLIPGNAKRRLGELKHEDGEGSVGGKALHRYVHVLVRAVWADPHSGARIGQASLRPT